MNKPAIRIIVFFACTLLWHQTSCGVSPSKKGIAKMNENQQKISQVLNLSDHEYFGVTGDTKQKLELAIANALSAGSIFSNTSPSTTYTLAMPDVIDSEKYGEVPMLFASQETGLRRWEVSRALNLQMVLVDRQSGEVRTERFADDPPGKRLVVPAPSQSDPKPSDSDQRAVITGILPINLKQYFNIADRDNQYSVTVIMYDSTSNTESFTIASANKTTEKPEALPTVSAFLQNAKTSSTKNTDPISLSFNTKDGENVTVASCQVSIPKSEATLLKGQNDTSILPASLLLIKIDEETPVKVDLYVGLTQQGGDDHVNMEWQFDIDKAIESSTLQGQYQAYLISGAHVSPPVHIDL